MKRIKYLALITFISVGILSCNSIQKIGYHVNFVNEYDVKITDENYQEIRTTTLDSIGYYINQDNI
jgi:hypothetical protein